MRNGKKTDRTSSSTDLGACSGWKSIVWCLPTGALGAAIWFGTQILSLRDNFSDSVNPWYFVALYAAAFFLGLIVPSNAILTGLTLALSQIVSYLIYPNVLDQLGNLFPITAALLLACTSPAVLLAFSASRIRDRIPASREQP